MKGQWTFNTGVAETFDEIAQTNIPNYEPVIQQCVDIALSAFPDKEKTRIIDVGSATGYTLERLRATGYKEVFGVDNSPSMLGRSRVQENLILSQTFPKEHGPFDIVIANWTLHFVDEREAYLRDIYHSLNPGGLLILSDKMLSSTLTHQKYHDFKRSKGLSEEYIHEKAAAIEGVLTPRPCSWYQETLANIGFTDIEIINALWCFNTLLCRVKEL